MRRLSDREPYVNSTGFYGFCVRGLLCYAGEVISVALPELQPVDVLVELCSIQPPSSFVFIPFLTSSMTITSSLFTHPSDTKRRDYRAASIVHLRLQLSEHVCSGQLLTGWWVG